MKKTLLWSALFALISSQVTAEITQQPVTQTQNQNQIPTPTPTPTQGTANPLVTQTSPSQVQDPQLTQNPQGTQTVGTQPVIQNSGQPVQSTTSQTNVKPVINCDYKIPAQTKNIDQTLVLTWSEKALTQVFDFEPTTIDTQVQHLKACFTDQGWAGFNTALEKSGNIEAIKTQKLTVSSQIDGQSQVTSEKDNVWKITLPLHVVYQNDKEKVTQLLQVNLTVGRKITGDLGIMQMIATPRPAPSAAVQNTSSPSNPASGVQPANQAKPASASDVNALHTNDVSH